MNVDLPSGEVLILAGDILVSRYLDPSRKDEKSKFLRERFLSFFNDAVSKFDLVLYVTGNHEPYGTSIQLSDALIAEHLPKEMVWLKDDWINYNGVRFVGGTLWCGLHDPFNSYAVQEGLNDFRAIKWENERFTTFEARELHRGSLEAITGALGDKTMPTVVVTHHAPSLVCIHPDFIGDSLNDGFYTNLHYLFEQNENLIAWFCGHTHNRGIFRPAGAPIIMNCRGYYGDSGAEALAKSFDPDTVFELVLANEAEGEPNSVKAAE